jgi:glycosyltransferase involved in cell wall biosynthesis
VLDEQTALLCAPTPAALGAAIADVLATPGVYAARGEAARERVVRDYSRVAFSRKLLDAYGSVLAPPTRSSVASSM